MTSKNFFSQVTYFDTMNRRCQRGWQVGLAELMRVPLPRIAAQISRVRRTASPHLTRSHRSSSLGFRKLRSGIGTARSVRECRTMQRDTAGRILSSVTVSMSDQNRVSRGTVLSFAIVGRALPHRVTFLFPRPTPDVQLNNQ